jgi:hypothetical protein
MKNYGSMLQAYATQKILDDLEIENETICIDGLSNEIKYKKLKYFFSKILDIDILKNKFIVIKHKLCEKINFHGFKNKMFLRNEAFKEFSTTFKISKRYSSFEELNKECIKYTDVLVGSDQLWLPSNIAADYYTLNWVPENINKISYATSFGVSTLEEKYEKLTNKFLKRITHLSVREQSGKSLIKKISGMDVQVVCDPTLLFTSECWMDIQTKEPIIDGKYIFCYFIGNNPEQREFVNKIKLKTGYKIVALQHIDEYIKSDEDFADEAPYDVTPGDFINLIRNAEYVCTDSFHGSVFSILNSRKFFAFRRFKQNRKVSTNSRLDSLFNLLGLEERLLTGNENVEELLCKEIEYDKVHERLSVFRENSKEFLKEALKID